MRFPMDFFFSYFDAQCGHCSPLMLTFCLFLNKVFGKAKCPTYARRSYENCDKRNFQRTKVFNRYVFPKSSVLPRRLVLLARGGLGIIPLKEALGSTILIFTLIFCLLSTTISQSIRLAVRSPKRFVYPTVIEGGCTLPRTVSALRSRYSSPQCRSSIPPFLFCS